MDLPKEAKSSNVNNYNIRIEPCFFQTEPNSFQTESVGFFSKTKLKLNRNKIIPHIPNSNDMNH